MSSFYVKSTSRVSSNTLACSYVSSKKEAQLTAPNGYFTQRVQLDSARPFQMKQIILHSGPYEGHAVFVVEPLLLVHEALPLMRLPPEIRLMIFEQVIVAPGPIVSVLRDHKLWMTTEAEHLGALLHVNKAISREVAPLIYGSNTFSFDTAKGANVFMDTISTNRAFVKNILIRNMWQVSHGDILVQHMLRMTNLTSLSFKSTLNGIKYLHRALLPLLKSQDRRGIQQLLDKIDFAIVSVTCRSNRCTFPQTLQDRNCIDCSAKCKSELKRRMKVLLKETMPSAGAKAGAAIDLAEED